MDIQQLKAQYRAGERNFKGVQLREMNLVWVDLSGVDLQGANLSHANLSGANLSEANLSDQTDLSFADLSRADLQNANLRGTRLEGANLEGVQLQGALYDETTRFPIGFDPLQAGAVPTGKLQNQNAAATAVANFTTVRESLKSREIGSQELPPEPAAIVVAEPELEPLVPVINNSGQGSASMVPSEIKRQWNLGALLLPWFWFLPNRVWFGLWVWVLGFLPWIGGFITWGFALAMAVNGNRWAWQSRRWKSVEVFQKHQRYWVIAGVVFWAGKYLYDYRTSR
jgi:hypothetical protein